MSTQQPSVEIGVSADSDKLLNGKRTGSRVRLWVAIVGLIGLTLAGGIGAWVWFDDTRGLGPTSTPAELETRISHILRRDGGPTPGNISALVNLSTWVAGSVREAGQRSAAIKRQLEILAAAATVDRARYLPTLESLASSLQNERTSRPGESSLAELASSFQILARHRPGTPEASDPGTDVLAHVKRFADNPQTVEFVGMLTERMVNQPRWAYQMVDQVLPFLAAHERSRALGQVRERLQLWGKPIELAGRTPTGGTFSFEQLRGQVVLIDFWASWCQPCMEDIPRLRALADRYAARGFAVVGVSLDQTTGPWVQFVETQAAPWHHIWNGVEGDSSVPTPAQRFGVAQIPTKFLVDREGFLVSVNTANPLELAKRIEAELARQPR